jgi:acetyl esterase/lipase
MLPRFLALSLLFSTAISAHHVSPDDLLRESIPPADQKLSYGIGPLQFGELRLPKTKGPHPVVMMIHGGCWADRLEGLDPRATAFDLLRALAAGLTAAGDATWNIEYRRTGNPGGGWPGTYQDVSKATDFLRTIAPKYDLDLKRVVVIGHSAGGQLAVWLAARSKLPASSAAYSKNPLVLKAIVDIDGPPDIAAAQPVERNFCTGDPVITQFMNGTPAQQPLRYKEGSVTSYLPLGVPQELVVAALLQGVIELVPSYEALAKAKGDHVTVTTFQGSSHFDLLSPGNPFGKRLIERVQQSLSAK